VLAGVDGEVDSLERIGRLGARLILQQALEDEVTEFLGRVRDQRADEPVSYRNGYEPRRVVTTAGPVERPLHGCPQDDAHPRRPARPV
jgi:putative transposase